MPKIVDIEKAHRIKCFNDFEFYARRNLHIRPKEGDLLPLILNSAQKYVHDKLEAQRKKTGKVRALILKGRQQGMSTYIEGRFFWKTAKSKGVRAFILAHESDSTASLFSMAKRYYDNCPIPMRPSLHTSNAKELIFDKLDSGYKIGTAGNEAVGRSQTNQFFHGSEVGFWKNTGELVKGVLQTVPDMDDTEVIYESTANGVGNFFHQQCLKAMKGEGEYQFIFIEWFLQKEYTKKNVGKLELTEEEVQLRKLYKLTNGQLMWRRNKIIELSTDGKDGTKAFKQEYPCNPNEAFQVTGEDGLISPECVMRARKATNINPSGPLVVGVDPSRGGDRFAVARRRNRVLYDIEGHTGDLTLGRKVVICKKILDQEDPEIMFVDMGGGDDLVDRLHELGYGRQVRGIWFGGSPLEPEKYKNRRAEMGGLLNEWLNDEHLPVQIPDDDAVQADFCTPWEKRDSMDRIQLESKADIKKRVGFSTDYFDAAGLTFAEPVRNANSRKPRVKRAYTPG